MHELVYILPSIFERGLIFSLIIMGMYLSSRILKFDDLTLEGTFGLAGALTASLLFNNVNPIIAITVSIIAGGIAGACTALLHTKLQFNQLISGMIVATALFSVSLKIAGANVSVADLTIFEYMPHWPLHKMLFLALLNIGALYALQWFLKTELGFLVRATGINQQMVRILGKRVHYFIILGLILSNMLYAFAGSLFVQYVGFFSIWNNVGILIISLAGLILAETINRNLGFNIFIGAIAYQLIIATTFELQLDQDWNKMITALLIITLIAGKQYITDSFVEKRC